MLASGGKILALGKNLRPTLAYLEHFFSHLVPFYYTNFDMPYQIFHMLAVPLDNCSIDKCPNTRV